MQAPLYLAVPLVCTALLDLYDLFEMKMNFVGRSKTASGERESRRFVARDYQSSAAPCGFKLLGTLLTITFSIQPIHTKAVKKELLKMLTNYSPQGAAVLCDPRFIGSMTMEILFRMVGIEPIDF